MTRTNTQPIRLILGEFEDIVSRGLQALVSEHSHLTLVAADVDHRDLATTLADTRADVAILNLGSLSTQTEVRDLHATFPDTRLVLLADHASPTECRQLGVFGADACLPKSADADELLEAICVGSRPHDAIPSIATQPAPGAPLTPREAEVLELLRSGLSNAEIAATLHVGFETLRTHTSSIYRKLGVSCRRELRSSEIALAQSDPAS